MPTAFRMLYTCARRGVGSGIIARESKADQTAKRQYIIQMKKTLTLIALAFAVVSAQAADTTLYWGGNTHHDNLLEVQSGTSPSGLTFPWLSNASGGGRMDANEYTTLTTEGDTTYSLKFNLTGDVDFALNDAVYFNSVTVGASMPTNYTIDLGTKGSITTAEEFNIGNAHKTDGSFTLSADFSAETMAELIADAHNGTATEYSRDLLVAGGKNGFWNLSERYEHGHLTFTSGALASSGLVYAGIVKDADQILNGQYGLVYTELAGNSNYEKIMLVAKTPEPATATLSLLALAALASRRKRH